MLSKKSAIRLASNVSATSTTAGIVELLARLRSRSCIIDDEAVCCDEGGFAQFIRLPPGTGARLN